ncbi:MAG TPA: cupin domain-containing protein [Syntrophales bacterium]|nr:cupin domain-containing protein [Syntrophales bacterium]
MLLRHSEALPVEVVPGLVRRTLAEGKAMMICEFSLDEGVKIPMHSHPHEQVGYVVSGSIRMTIGESTFEMNPGDSYFARAGVPHGVVVLHRAVVVDTFSPPREDYRVPR